MKRIPWRHFVGPNYADVIGCLYGCFGEGLDIYADQFRGPEMSIYKSPEIANSDPPTKIWATILLAPLLRGTTTTQAAVNGYLKVIKAHPDWLDPAFLDSQEPSQVFSVLREAGLGSLAKEAAKEMVHNAGIFEDIPSPLGLFWGLKTFHQAHYVLGIPRYAEPGSLFEDQRNLGLKGFGGTGKVLALVLQMLMDVGLIDWFPLPVAPDFHYLRIMLACQGIKIPRRSQVITAYSLARIAREISLELPIFDRQLYPHFSLEFSAATYILGNQVCSRHPEMTANPILPHKRKKTKGGRYTPISQLCRIPGRSEDLGICRDNCPVQWLCTLIVPSGPYHELGYIAPVRKLRSVLRKKGLI